MTEQTASPRHPHTAWRVGGWLPADPGAVKSFVADLVAEVEARPAPLSPSVEALARVIDGDPIIHRLAQDMIQQVPGRYRTNPSGGPLIESIQQMLALINAAIRKPPPHNDTELVGFPINAILDWSMGTPAGTTFFRIDAVNEALKGVLRDWCGYLCSEASLTAFEGPHSWGSAEAQARIDIERFKHVPGPPPWGFTSWNDFFIREFKDDRRPVADPGDDRVIVSACESTPFSIQDNVKREDRFWIKAQPYSLERMLEGQHVEAFEGGTVYQAFLSAFDYHRWHSPVSGTIVSAEVVDGTYYAEALSEGYDPGGPNLSQGYIAHIATRAIIFIEADNPRIGLMAVIPIGMSEVSSNILQLEDGKPLEKGVHVDKGDQLGYFQFGGSTHCLVFRPRVIESFERQAIPCPNVGLVELKSKIATARS